MSRLPCYFCSAPSFLSPGMLGLIRLLRGRGVTLGQLSAALIVIGAIAISGFLSLSMIETEAVDPAADRTQMFALLERAEDSPAGAIFLILFIGGLTLGSILLAAGLLLKRAAPIWVPIALLASTVVNSIGGESQVGNVVGFALLAAALIPLGLRGPLALRRRLGTLGAARRPRRRPGASGCARRGSEVTVEFPRTSSRCQAAFLDRPMGPPPQVIPGWLKARSPSRSVLERRSTISA